MQPASASSVVLTSSPFQLSFNSKHQPSTAANQTPAEINKAKHIWATHCARAQICGGVSILLPGCCDLVALATYRSQQKLSELSPSDRSRASTSSFSKSLGNSFTESMGNDLSALGQIGTVISSFLKRRASATASFLNYFHVSIFAPSWRPLAGSLEFPQSCTAGLDVTRMPSTQILRAIHACIFNAKVAEHFTQLVFGK